MTQLFIGVDPGVSGGIAIVSERGTVILAMRMPETEKDILEGFDAAFIEGLLAGEKLRTCRAVIEKVHAGAFAGGRRQGASSAFTFGRNYGALLMALTAARIPFDLVPPRAWQQAIGVVYPADVSQTEKKNITKRRAQQLFPDAKVTHAIADALLLAEYARRSSGWGIRPSRGVRQLPDPKGSTHGEKEKPTRLRQQPTAEGARAFSNQGQRELLEDIARGEGEGFELVTAAERRRAEAAQTEPAPRHGAGSRHGSRSVV